MLLSVCSFAPTITRWFACLIVAASVSVAAAASDAVLVEFSSEHCPPCRAMQPIVSELIARGVPVRQVDVQAEPQLTRRFEVRSTPTYIVLRDGREVTRLKGTQSVSQLRAALAQTGGGPIVPTRTESQPQTRLAPMINNAVALTNAPTQSFRRDDGVAGEPMPSVDMAGAVERAQAATVRLRVYDGQGYGAGTGTIIDVHGEEALVLTCGHLFRDGETSDKIEVDLFIGGQAKTVIGHLVDFDAGDRDIGVVAIRPGVAIDAVEILRENEVVRVGQTAFSFGCDRGADPSRRDTRITGVDKYNQNVGASNFEISGAPIDGRSGGGLFDDRGRLIGVCNAADYESDIGIYTGPGSIQWQLDRVKLSHLYQTRSDDTPTSLASVSPEIARANPDMSFDSASTANFASDERSPASNVLALDQSSTEMIVILRDRSGATREQVITLDRPDAQLVQQIRQAAHNPVR